MDITAIVLGAILGILVIAGFVYGKIQSYATERAGIDTATYDTQVKEAIKEAITELFGPIGSGLGMVSILMSDVVFLAGFIIDMINQSYKYSIASIIGFLNTAFLGL